MARLNSSGAGNFVCLCLYCAGDVHFITSPAASLITLDHSAQSHAALCRHRALFFLRHQPAQRFAGLLPAGLARADFELLATQKCAVSAVLPAALLASKRRNTRLLPDPASDCGNDIPPVNARSNFLATSRPGE